jgi:ABC-type sulfate transport system permease subunit
MHAVLGINISGLMTLVLVPGIMLPFNHLEFSNGLLVAAHGMEHDESFWRVLLHGLNTIPALHVVPLNTVHGLHLAIPATE